MPLMLLSQSQIRYGRQDVAINTSSLQVQSEAIVSVMRYILKVSLIKIAFIQLVTINIFTMMMVQIIFHTERVNGRSIQKIIEAY